LLAVNFWRGIRVIASLRRGTNAIGRWTVTAAELAEFAASNKARNALGIEHHNEWHMPRDLPAAGIEVTFAPDRVLVGDTYFALSTTGLFRFTNVWMLAGTTLAIAFRTLLTLANRFGARVTLGELRIPVSRLAGAEAARAVTYFEEMSAGKMIANPNFYRTRLRVGLIGAPTFLAIAALGFVLGPNDMSEGSMSISSLMVIIGLVAGITMLILALAAKLLGGCSGRAQERQRLRRILRKARNGAMQARARAHACLPAPPVLQRARVRSRPPATCRHCANPLRKVAHPDKEAAIGSECRPTRLQRDRALVPDLFRPPDIVLDPAMEFKPHE
jgi:hypothetical protein